MSDTQNTQSDAPTAAQAEDTVLARLLFMLLFGVVGYFVFWASLLAAGLQFIVRLVTGAVNDELVQFSTVLSDYLGDILRFVSFQTDDKPFPFNEQKKTDVTVTDA